MQTSSDKRHPRDSSEQRAAESEILRSLEKQLKVHLDAHPQINQRINLDGFADTSRPVCVEIWAHQGPAKGSQPSKVMGDFCKLLLVEKLLGKPCRKIFAVCDPEALAFLKNSWRGRFADEWGIESIVVPVSKETRRRLRQTQKNQGW